MPSTALRLPALAVALTTTLVVLPTTPAQTFTRHVAVAQEGHAADAGRDALRDGGNAIDAAVATAFALAVTHPAAGNHGGGGFIVAYLADRHQVVSIDFREMAPGASTPTMYLDDAGKIVPRHRAGPRAAGVPGTVRGLGLAQSKYGKLPWKRLVEPAVALAREGFIISDTLARGLNAQLFSDADPSGVPEDLGPQADRLALFPASVAAYRHPDARPWKAGDRLVQGDLAATLQRIADGGPDEFYTGETAQKIVAYMQSDGGLISADDLAAYQAHERTPTHVRYRGYDVYGIAPPASGGIVLGTMLGILERYDLKASGPKSPRTLHLVTEAQRRAYFVRATELADPDFVPVDTARLLSKPFIDSLAGTITDRATPSAALAPFPIAGLPAEGEHTTHLSTIDGDGNAVALTYTLEEGYGSKAVVPGAGFLLNNEMGDFNLIPGRTDATGRIGTPPNLIAPHKRMLSSQTPTVVLKDGKVRLVTGSPGGRTIPNTVLWVVLGVLEFGLEPQAAVDLGRTHHQWFPDVVRLEGRSSSWPPYTRDRLEARGHTVGSTAIQGDAHSIVVDPATGLRIGAADRRRSTSKASGD
jgi:gamma-glutamyltranspeptidase/glutathione hydrolase